MRTRSARRSSVRPSRPARGPSRDRWSARSACRGPRTPSAGGRCDTGRADGSRTACRRAVRSGTTAASSRRRTMRRPLCSGRVRSQARRCSCPTAARTAARSAPATSRRSVRCQPTRRAATIRAVERSVPTTRSEPGCDTSISVRTDWDGARAGSGRRRPARALPRSPRARDEQPIACRSNSWLQARVELQRVEQARPMRGDVDRLEHAVRDREERRPVSSSRCRARRRPVPGRSCRNSRRPVWATCPRPLDGAAARGVPGTTAAVCPPPSPHGPTRRSACNFA